MKNINFFFKNVLFNKLYFKVLKRFNDLFVDYRVFLNVLICMRDIFLY